MIPVMAFPSLGRLVVVANALRQEFLRREYKMPAYRLLAFRNSKIRRLNREAKSKLAFLMRRYREGIVV